MEIIKHIHNIAVGIIIGTVALMSAVAALSGWGILPEDLWWPALLTVGIAMFAGWAVIAASKYIDCKSCADDKADHPWMTREISWALVALLLMGGLIIPGMAGQYDYYTDSSSSAFSVQGDPFFIDEQGYLVDPSASSVTYPMSEVDGAVYAYETFDDEADQITDRVWIAPKAFEVFARWQEQGLMSFDPSTGQLTVMTPVGIFTRGPFSEDEAWRVAASGRLDGNELVFSFTYHDDSVEQVTIGANDGQGLAVTSQLL